MTERKIELTNELLYIFIKELQPIKKCQMAKRFPRCFCLNTEKVAKGGKKVEKSGDISIKLCHASENSNFNSAFHFNILGFQLKEEERGTKTPHI